MTSLPIPGLSRYIGGFAALLALSATASAQNSFRATVSLNGTWQSATTQDATNPPADSAWQNTSAPQVSWISPDGGTHYLWYRREVDIPADWAGRRIFVDARGIRYTPRLYVNGKLIAEQYNGWAPFTVEITQAVQPGRKCELEFRCADRGALLDTNGKMLAPVGGYKDNVGIWDNLFLKSKPADEIDDGDLAIVPSTRKQTLTVTGTASGDTANLWIDAAVIDGNTKVLNIPPVQVNADGTWTLATAFKNAHYWSPEDPHLYHLSLTLLHGRNGAVADSYEQRFGFKEFWTDGPDFYLNGVKRHMLGTSTWPEWAPQSHEAIWQGIRTVKSSNAIIFRLHNSIWPEEWLNAADELGLLIIDETPLYTDGNGSYAYNDPRFWANMRDVAAGMIRRDRNHASLAMWSMGNEILFMGNQKYDQDLPKKEGDLGRYAKSLDTHPITFEADQDPDGAYDVIGLHYPHESPWVDDYPNTCDWLGARTTTQALGGMLGKRSTSFFWERKKPLYIGEYLWMPEKDYSNSSIFYGDDAYLNHEDYLALAQQRAFFFQTIAYRRSGVSGLGPWTALGFGAVDEKPALVAVQHTMYQPLAAYLRTCGLRYFGGEQAKLTFDVFNDGVAAHSYELRLVRRKDGKTIVSTKLTLEPAGYRGVTLSYPIPIVADRSRIGIDAVLYSEGREVFREQHELKIFPRRALTVPAGIRLVAFDPSGKWPASTPTLTQLSQVNPARTILLIAPSALSGDTKDANGSMPVIGGDRIDRHVFVDFLNRGGKAIVLEQSSLAALGLGFNVVDHASTMTFPLRTSSPLLAGLDADDLSFWRSDNYVARYQIERPAAQGARAISVSGGPNGLERAPIVDVNVGRGRLILLEALVGEKRDREPAAATILQNAVNTLVAPQPALRTATISFAAPAFNADLAKLGIPVRDAGSAEPGNLILDGTVQNVDAVRTAARATLASGGTVYWHTPDASDFTALRDTLGLSGLVPQAEPHGPSIDDRADPLLDGVSREDVTYTSAPHDYDRSIDTYSDAAAVCVLPASNGPAVLRIDAAAGNPVNGTPADLGGAKAETFGGNGGELRFPVNAPKAGAYVLTIDAQAKAENGTYPTLRLDINHVQQDLLPLRQADRREYRTLIALNAGKNELAIRFDNPSGGKSLTLGSIAVFGPAPYPAGAVVHLLPGALVTVRAGRGLVVLDGMRWNATGDNATKGARYASALLANVGFSFTPPSGAQYTGIPLGSFKLVGESPYSDLNSDTITLRAAGTVGTQFTSAHAGRYRMRLSGYSTAFHGGYADVRIAIDGKDCGVVTLNSGTPEDFDGPIVTIDKGVHTLTLAFINDESDATEDRNLFLKGVSVSAF